MALLEKNYVMLLGTGLAALLALAAWLLQRSSAAKAHQPSRGVRARVERHEHGAVVVLPPQPGARSHALIWTLLPTLLTAYVCLIINASPMGWALFVGSVLVISAVAACSHREILTTYYLIDAHETLRIARGWRSRPGASAPLSPPKSQSPVMRGRDREGQWYFVDTRREDEGGWGRLSNEDAELLRSLRVPDGRCSPGELPLWTTSTWLNTLAGFALLAAVLHPVLSPLASIEPPHRAYLHGSFRADHASLGQWNAAPQRCLSGRERGFEGVLFLFSGGSAVREIRVDMERSGENTLELRFFELNREPVRIAERECERIEGETESSVVSINGRDMDFLEGRIVIECRRHGLSAELSYRGCLP